MKIKYPANIWKKIEFFCLFLIVLKKYVFIYKSVILRIDNCLQREMILLPNICRKIFCSSNFTGAICLLLFFLYLLPFLILRQNAHFPINDNLDWITGWIMLANSAQALSLEGQIPQVMNGVPRSSMPSGFNVITWLYMIFPPFQAYLINFIIVHSVAFLGAYLFLNLLAEKANFKDRSFIIWGTALCFALLPFYTVYGLSIAGQPLLAYAFLNIYYDKKLLKSFLIIIGFTFYSSLPLVGVFIIVAMALIAFLDFWQKKILRKNFIFAIFTLAASYCIAEIWLVYSVLFPDGIVSSRTEIDRIAIGQNRDFIGVLKLIARNFVFGQYHAVSLHYYILIAAVPMGVLAGIFTRDSLLKKLLLFLSIAFFISVIYGFRYFTPFMELSAQSDFLNAFQIQRFHWFHPFLWCLIFALSLAIISRLKIIGKFLAIALLSLQVAFLFANNIEYNLLLKEKEIISQDSQIMPNAWIYENITYKEFFSERLFQKVDAYIGRPKEDYRVLSIGIYPAITQYNGFYTLDGRLNIYPLEYKHEFRKIIEKELDKNPFWRNYFDNWGITCYILPAELQYLQVRKTYLLTLKNLELNSAQIKNLGGEYIFSAAEIENYQQTGLTFLTRITDDESPWEIFLYKVE